jgi:GH35 family endo-1,4-beta-xylanase
VCIAGYHHGISESDLQKAYTKYTTGCRMVYCIQDTEFVVSFAKLHVVICHYHTLLYHNHFCQWLWLCKLLRDVDYDVTVLEIKGDKPGSFEVD